MGAATAARKPCGSRCSDNTEITKQSNGALQRWAGVGAATEVMRRPRHFIIWVYPSRHRERLLNITESSRKQKQHRTVPTYPQAISTSQGC
eukprot:1159341-Pyramimonas_sp.AAC.1